MRSTFRFSRQDSNISRDKALISTASLLKAPIRPNAVPLALSGKWPQVAIRSKRWRLEGSGSSDKLASISCVKQKLIRNQARRWLGVAAEPHLWSSHDVIRQARYTSVERRARITHPQSLRIMHHSGVAIRLRLGRTTVDGEQRRSTPASNTRRHRSRMHWAKDNRPFVTREGCVAMDPICMRVREGNSTAVLGLARSLYVAKEIDMYLLLGERSYHGLINGDVVDQRVE